MRGLLLFLLALPMAAQDYTVTVLSRHVITNEGVITLAKAGFDELFIVERIHTSRTRFDTTVEGLVALKQAGVSEDLIDYMASHDIHARPFAAEGAASAARMAPVAPNGAFVPVALPPPIPPTIPSAAAAPAAQNGRTMVLVDKHWWGFHWVRVTK
jgi:hypothetical protein